MRLYVYAFSFVAATIVLLGCNQSQKKDDATSNKAEQVKSYTLETWQAYKTYAWGNDVLLPLSKGGRNWYDESLYISPIDAYSTLALMGFEEETTYIESYVVDSISFDKDIFVKVFEVNIRVLGGLLSMYHNTQNPAVLAQAQDFADRMLPAFESGTGIPHYWVNLRTGAVKGDTVNVAEAGTYTLEMGILSYYTGNPVYYQKALKATRAVFDRRSELDLIGENIDIETGNWTNPSSHICAGIDSYYEYMYKSWLLFGDATLKDMWDISIKGINTYLPETKDSLLWYGRVDMNTGERISRVITLYDAFFPGTLALSGDLKRAEELQHTWDWLWNKYGLEPMVYDYGTHTPNYPVYDLNPEIIESAYYLYVLTGKQEYRQMVDHYYQDILTHCKTDIAFTAVENVETMEKRDYMATYFLAETLKYLYLTYAGKKEFDFNEYIFTTEAHTFRRDAFKKELIIKNLGI